MSLPKIRLERCTAYPDGVWLLDDEQKKHLTRSLRLYEGAVVEGLLEDRDASGRKSGMSGRKFILRLERDGDTYALRETASEDVPGDGLSLTLLIGLLKADQFESVLRASAEIGVSCIRPLICERSVPRIKEDELEKKMSRWRRIIDEGSKVSGVIAPPSLAAPADFSDIEWDSLPGKKYAAILSPGTAHIKECYTPSTERPDEVAFAVGPEGDWSDGEAASLLGGGFVPVSLGERILRASTAALIGCGWFRLSHMS